MNIGMNTVLMQMNDPQKWIFPSRSFIDRKSTRLNSSHSQISYAVFCLKKKTEANAAGPPAVIGLPAALEGPHPSRTLCPAVVLYDAIFLLLPALQPHHLTTQRAHSHV